MDLSSLLLVIINRLDGERSINAGFHLLRGKRSGQTLQDVEYYNLKSFFGILQKLRLDVFDKAAEELLKANYISIDENSLVHLTEGGRKKVNSLPIYNFHGWDYRGRESVFFARLSLIVQTISNLKVGMKSFMPIQKDLDVQLFVKKLYSGRLIDYDDLSTQLKEELHKGFENSKMANIQKVILTHRLGGFGHTGWTWDQLAEKLNSKPIVLHLYYVEGLHSFLKAIDTMPELTLLNKIAENIKVATYLTDSSLKTKELFEAGMSMHDIATTRRLKMSTIEDHFVEMSNNDSNFPIEHFVSTSDMQAVHFKVNELGTKRLRLLKNEFPTLTYFQLRLILGLNQEEVRSGY